MIFLDQRVSARAVADAAEMAPPDGDGKQPVKSPLWKPAVVVTL